MSFLYAMSMKIGETERYNVSFQRDIRYVLRACLGEILFFHGKVLKGDDAGFFVIQSIFQWPS